MRAWTVVRAAIELGIAGVVAAASPRAAGTAPGGLDLEVSGAPVRLVVFEEFTRPT